ncbi:CDP-diacylglycerol--serine O-phosphatidyltransferase [Thiomicrospira sp. WB1]|uniref:CDP-diacylglycerol--serine O-phosphatidyltransferase n=1 Tax=Thiomicrospira sp. WB1 TaxID=1685380 RepID=UPI00074677AA|nr:CDP-diacylglycerol--serine O-phosphatidyltransferase [Thiomicrospira sp. WB1]KUJ71428.1 CDP-diacylglycerol--serine O-phosphatidyltransferase [Thiomicrospira sp. WB1]
MKSFEKGIYLLPNLMTMIALFSGFYAVIAGMNGEYELGAIAIFVAMVFDGLDGRIARMTQTSSAFGAEFDSLADMVSFGLAPALLMYQWALSDYGKIGWVVAFVFTAAAALRLARFNTQVGVADKRYFQGLPSPAAAALLAGFIWMFETNPLNPELAGPVAMVLTAVAGLMMVSNIRFSSFKELNLKDKVPFVTLLLAVLIFVVITLKPSMILFLLFLLYAISGPIWTLKAIQQRRSERRRASKTSEPDALDAGSHDAADTTSTQDQEGAQRHD